MNEYMYIENGRGKNTVADLKSYTATLPSCLSPQTFTERRKMQVNTLFKMFWCLMKTCASVTSSKRKKKVMDAQEGQRKRIGKIVGC